MHQIEESNMDLSPAKYNHQKHKVCEGQSKCSKWTCSIKRSKAVASQLSDHNTLIATSLNISGLR
ncbi:hypothetical protein OROHE_025805 [Orobanche hederae]